MPQLNKTNILITFIITWIMIITTTKMVKNINLLTTTNNNHIKHHTKMWYWPYI
uniref:ATPase subunit 8 n=1 Tax=Gerrhopilus ceylonicus TaxID=3148149 RepID=A0PDN2_9SAUR|nr:ATPase subunit 8 [Gerrhopilus mirus]